jgi:cytochrome c biogenesis protein CcdA
MKKLIALIVSIAVVDSLNPSTVGPAIYLATRRHAVRTTSSFTAGVFGVNLAAGLVLTLGPGQLIIAAIPHVGAHTKHLLELIAGLAALAVVPVLWRVRHRVAHGVTGNAKLGGGSTLALGAGIALAELPTAFPYFVVIAAIIGSGSNVATDATLVLLFNVVLILPLLAIVAASIHPGSRGRGVLDWLRRQIDRWAALLIPLVVLIVGVALVVLGAVGSITD